MDLYLKDKHVVIAGGSSGIGFACALEYLKEGSKVSIISRNDKLLLESYSLLIEKVPKAAGKLFTYKCDVTDAVEVDKTIDLIEESIGAIDVLVNSFGTSPRHHAFNTTAEDWRVTMHTKYFPYMNMIVSILNKMKQRGYGSIVSVAGTGGKVPILHAIPRGVSSSAIMLATVGLAAEFGKFGIRLNVVNSDAVLNGNHLRHLPLKERIESITLETAASMATAKMPFGRAALASEIADAIVFVSSPRASYISGAVLTVDGAANPLI
jgi:NAD(P)-dependent dehydrogenase (short-subunit alcohol dehydrogenase family)